MFQWQPQNVSMYVCPCDVRMHMWRTCVHVTYVCTCDVRVYMWRTYAHVTYVCTCDVRVHIWRTCVHVTYVCTCDVRVHMWHTCTCEHVRENVCVHMWRDLINIGCTYKEQGVRCVSPIQACAHMYVNTQVCMYVCTCNALLWRLVAHTKSKGVCSASPIQASTHMWHWKAQGTRAPGPDVQCVSLTSSLGSVRGLVVHVISK